MNSLATLPRPDDADGYDAAAGTASGAPGALPGKSAAVLKCLLAAGLAAVPEAQRDTLRSLEVTLLNVATDLVTQAVGKVLDDAQQSVDDLLAVTSQARDVIGRIADVKQNIAIATALIGLAAAISAGGGGRYLLLLFSPLAAAGSEAFFLALAFSLPAFAAF
eukprot:gene4166-4932_t